MGVWQKDKQGWFIHSEQNALPKKAKRANKGRGFWS